MRTELVFLVLGMSLVGGCNREPEPPLVDAKTLMAKQVQPTAQIFWDSVQYVSNETGNHEIFPRTDAEWNRTLQAAQALKQLGEQLKGPSYAAGRGADWQDYAQGLADVARQAEQAAKDRNVDKVFEVGGSIYNVCSACHEVYMPTPAGLAPEDSGGAKATP